MSKGSSPRQSQISREQFNANWDTIFTNKDVDSVKIPVSEFVNKISNKVVGLSEENCHKIQMETQDFITGLFNQVGKDHLPGIVNIDGFCKYVGSGFFSFVYEAFVYKSKHAGIDQEEGIRLMEGCFNHFMQGCFEKAKFLKTDFMETEEHL